LISFFKLSVFLNKAKNEKESTHQFQATNDDIAIVFYPKVLDKSHIYIIYTLITKRWMDLYCWCKSVSHQNFNQNSFFLFDQSKQDSIRINYFLNKKKKDSLFYYFVSLFLKLLKFLKLLNGFNKWVLWTLHLRLTLRPLLILFNHPNFG